MSEVGELKLQEQALDCTLGEDARWHGECADTLNQALRSYSGFTWPKRLHDVVLSEGTIYFYANGHRITRIENDVPAMYQFRIVAKPGARITAKYLSEAP